MNLLDFIIVYLACGTPFAVYRIVLSEESAFETAIRSVLAALLWPIDGGKAAIKRLRSASRTLAKPRLENLRAEMEQILAANIPDFRRFEFREVFDRYVGLIRASDSSSPTTFTELANISGRELTAAGAACLHRASRVRVMRHASGARIELIEYIAAFPSPDLCDLAASLAAELSDDLLARNIAQYDNASDGRRRPTSVPPLSGSAS